MRIRPLRLFLSACAVVSLISIGADWTRFRGPNGSGISDEKGLPAEWGSNKNIVWRTKLPGPGTSSPIVLGKRIYLTSYLGYGIEPNQGEMKNLVRHVLCIDRDSGNIIWKKDFEPELPESSYSGGNNSRHGYASSTPTTDGKCLYVFFGKSGVYCLDLDGKQIWQASVGDKTRGWGSSNSPVVYKNLVIINASIESNSLVALDKKNGNEVWRTKGIGSSWNTPVLVDAAGKKEIVLATAQAILGISPETGRELWHADVFGRYTCPSVVAHDGVDYGTNRGTVAVRAGGRGDVTKSHVVWNVKKGPVVSSPVYSNGLVYWVKNGGTACCMNAKTGEVLYQERLSPNAGIVYSSPMLADGKIYCTSQENGVFVIAAGPKFEQLAHNTFKDDASRTNASPVASNGQLLIRTDQYLYCIGAKK